MGLIESKSQLVVVTKQWTTASIGLELGSSVNLFVADRPYQVVSVTERHSVVGSTLVMLVGALGSTPIGSAANLLASTIPTTGAVNVTNFGTLFGSAVLSGSTQFGTTATGPVLGSGDALGILYSLPANQLPVGTLQVVLQTI
jgi:hypothetical protein